MTGELRGIPGYCFDIDGNWWNKHGPGSGCRDCDPPGASGPILTAESAGWPALLRHVLLRDKRCAFAYLPTALNLGSWPLRGDPDHWCRSRYNEPINWSRVPSILEAHARGLVELNHVKEEPKMGQKAPDDEAHLVVVCWGAHHGDHVATSTGGLEFQRQGLAELYPQVWATFLARREAHDGS